MTVSNIISIFFKFDDFYEKTYEKTYQFYDLFSNFLSICARSENFVVWKFLLKKSRLFQNINNLLFISTTLSNICNKTYEKTYHCFYIFWNFHFTFLHAHKISWSPIFFKKSHLFQYVNKILLIPPTLNNIFDKNYEKSFNFCKVFFKFASIFTLSPSFIMTTLLKQKWQLFQCC